MDCLPLTPRRLLKHFCTLALTLWVAGHSGGGQIVHRPAVLNRLDERVRAAV